jgi:signal transduction histidine kinase
MDANRCRVEDGGMGQAAELTVDPMPPLAVLAHELRTPLAAIQAYADLMLESPPGPASEARLREHAAQIRRAAEIGLDVVATLLERHQGAAPATSHAPVSLPSVAASVARMMAPLVDRSRGHLAVQSGTGDARAETLASHVHEIVLNLVANALRHAGPSPTIVIRTGAEAGGASWIEVEASQSRARSRLLPGRVSTCLARCRTARA